MSSPEMSYVHPYSTLLRGCATSHDFRLSYSFTQPPPITKTIACVKCVSFKFTGLFVRGSNALSVLSKRDRICDKLAFCPDEDPADVVTVAADEEVSPDA